MNEELIRKWLEGTLSEEEKRILENSEEYEYLRQISGNIQAFKAPEYDVEKELKRFSSGNFTKVRKLNWTQTALRVAAAIAIIAVAWWFIPASVEDKIYLTNSGEKIEVYLPDSSLVHINASSQISLNEKKWNSNREIQLEGEAYFKVKKGSNFKVITNSGTVTVLGTEFNVKNRSDYYEVICYEGRVQVNSNGKEIKLSKNNLFRIVDTNVYEKEHASISPSWIANESSFTSVPLTEVFNEFERQYGIELTYNNIAMDQLFSGSFTHKNLTLALQAVTLPMNIEYEIIDDQTIVLTGELD